VANDLRIAKHHEQISVTPQECQSDVMAAQALIFFLETSSRRKSVGGLIADPDVKTTLQLYAHSISADRMTAQRET
jgi:hypothetical protein